MPTRDVLISGLGIAGPALAHWLRRYGFVPTLVERTPAPRQGGYMLDFWGVGYDVAERMGLVPALRQHAYELRELRVVDAHGRRIAGFGARVFDSATQGRFMSLLRGDLAHVLYENVRGDVEIIFGDSITRLDEDDRGVDVSFRHTPSRRFDLVIGADGLHSNVRSMTFGGRRQYERFLGYYVYAFSADHYPHRDEGMYVSYAAPGRQVARYALCDDRSAFLIVFADATQNLGAAGDAAEHARLVRERLRGAGWECDEIVRAMERADDLYFDAVAQTRMPEWSRGRVALVGDAAYCPSLLAGQGAAFGLAGAYLVAHALAAWPDEPRAAFHEYERRFRPFVEKKQNAAVKFAKWFAPRSRLGIWIRNIATGLLGAPVVGRIVAERSFGDRLELPAPNHLTGLAN